MIIFCYDGILNSFRRGIDLIMSVIAICCSKGGVGKTFTTLSLAVEFAFLSDKKKRILIIDSDPSRNATIAIVKNLASIKYTLLDVFKDKNFDIKKAIYEGTAEFPSVSVLASHEQLTEIESLLSQRKNQETILKRAIGSLNYDVILIDTPPNNGILTQNALAACDAFLVPVDHDRNAIDGFFSAVNSVEDLCQEGSIDKKPVCLGAVFTKVEENTAITKLMDKTADKEMHGHVVPVRIPKSIHTREAVFYATTIQFQRSHPVCKAYNKLTTYIIKKLNMKGF